jgi:hypothetical protein
MMLAACVPDVLQHALPYRPLQVLGAAAGMADFLTYTVLYTVRNTSAAKSSGLTTPNANFAEEAQCSGAISLLLLRFADDETDTSHQDVFENRMAMAKL